MWWKKKTEEKIWSFPPCSREKTDGGLATSIRASEGEIMFDLVKYPTIRIYVLEYLNIIIQLSEYAILPLCPSQKPWSALY